MEEKESTNDTIENTNSTIIVPNESVPNEPVPNEPVHTFDTVVLSGGGVKGFVLLGSIQAAFDLNLLTNVNIYVGTSVGAIICYLLAIGYTPIELIVAIHVNRWLERMQYFNIVAMTNGNGATTFNSVQEGLEKLTIEKIGKFITLGKLKEQYGKTLICATYNMTTCKMEYLGPDTHPDIPCITALKMSANLPLIFDRFKYMDCYYIDGGIFDNFPILKGEELGKKVLGLHVKISEKSLQDVPEDGILAYFFRLLQVPISQTTQYRSNLAGEKCTIVSVITKEMKTAFDFSTCSKERLELFSTGYSQVKEFFEKEKKY